jgi:hypothetical protein
VPAFIVAALVFGGLHLANPGATPLAGATVVMAGLMFCALYALTGRLWVPIGLHIAWNFAQGYLFGATVSGGNLGGSILLSTAHPGARSPASAPSSAPWRSCPSNESGKTNHEDRCMGSDQVRSWAVGVLTPLMRR